MSLTAQRRGWGGYASQLLTLAAPVIASQASSMLVNLADTLMVARLGDVPLAAVSFSGNLSVPFMFFGIGAAATITPLVGRRLGRGQTAELGRIVAHARAFNWRVVLLQVLILSILDILMPFMGQPAEVVEIAQLYLPIYIASLVGQQMFICSRTIIEGLQDTTSPMLTGLACNVLNIGLNYVFIFGLGPISGIGAYGAAVSTLICRTLMWITMEIILRRRLRHLGVTPARVKGHSITTRLFKMGFPMGAQAIIETLGFAFGGIMMGWISTEAIAAHQVVNSFTSMTFLMVGGLATAITIKVSLDTGAGNKASAKRYAVTGITMGGLFMCCTAILFFFTRNSLPALIISSPEALSIAADIMLMGAIFQVFDGLQAAALGALRGYADFSYPARVSTISYAATCAPVGYIFAFIFGFGPSGIWCGFIIGLALAAFLLLRRLKTRYWSF